MLDDVVGKRDRLARLGHQKAQHVVVGSVVAQPLEAADALQSLLAHRRRRAQRKACPFEHRIH